MLIWALVRSTGPRVVVVKVHRKFDYSVMFWIFYDGGNGGAAGGFTTLVRLDHLV